jgi:hypothetical protein
MRRRQRALVVAGAVAALAGAVGCRPGTPDADFGDGGTAVLDGPAGAITAAPASHGGVVVVRGDGELVRLEADGSVREGWGGPTPVPCAERDELDRDARDRYLLACTSTAEDGSRVTALVRWDARGRPDRSFGDGGVARLEGQVEGAAAVPLPGGRTLALGGRPYVAGRPPVLVTTVLDRRGRVLSTGERELATVESVPPEYRASTAVSVVAEPLSDGAAVAVHAETLLTLTPIFRPTDPFVLVFDRDGAEVARIEGPAMPGGSAAAESHVVALAEVGPGRVAVLEEWWQLVDGPRPSALADEVVHVYGPDGAEEASYTPVGPPSADYPDGRPVSARTLAATDGGRRLLVGGAWAPELYAWEGAVARVNTATGALDPGFGGDGIATTGVYGSDLDARADDPDRVDVTGPTSTSPGPDTPGGVTRLWNQPAPP